ncbi:MAG: RnfABCDGE type electron transport complex subunit B [Methylococcaceae bacterium]|nr:RnfABCDGE type electron transport complex subunit B [Methylococcaceae bacterium]
MTLIEQINSLLPQTQCTRCSYQGCKPYAEAIANNEADINQCPPAGDKGIQALADLLDKPFKPLNPEFGEYQTPSVAIVIEEDCIGCAKCLDACPVDAILGASKVMHTVIASECTGCELCIPPCPVDCIVMEKTELEYSPVLAKQRYEAKQQRLIRLQAEKVEKSKKQKEKLMAMMKAKAAAKRA